MANVILGWPNRAEQATLSGGAWSGSAPLDYLKSRFGFERARSVDTALASTRLVATLDKTREVGIVMLKAHNLTRSARYRLRLRPQEGAAEIHDSGWQPVWDGIHPFGTLPWGDESWWGGRPSAEELEGYPACLTVILPTFLRARQVEIEFDDQSNPAGYVEAARLWISSVWQPAYNVSYGKTLAWEHAPRIDEALDGTEYFDERPKTRAYVAALERLGHDDGHALYLEMTRQLGVSRELVLIGDPDDTVHRIRTSFIGRLRKLSPLESSRYRLYGGGLEIKETV